MLGGCGVLDRGFLSPAGPVAQVIHDEFLLVCLVMLFVIGPVLLLVPLVAWHYRLSNTKSAYRPQWGFNWPLEGLIWIPPTAIVVLLAVFLWRDTHRLDPYRPLPGEAIEVQAIAADWKWIFIYPEQGVATVNRLVIPAGRPVHLEPDQRHGDAVHPDAALAGQIYAMAGMRTQLNFQADAPGASSARTRSSTASASRTRSSPSTRWTRQASPAGWRTCGRSRTGSTPRNTRSSRAAARCRTRLPSARCSPACSTGGVAAAAERPHAGAAKLPPRPLPMAMDRARRTITEGP